VADDGTSLRQKSQLIGIRRQVREMHELMKRAGR
jgi:hypothetical protein